jgi:hypothetical protein
VTITMQMNMTEQTVTIAQSGMLKLPILSVDSPDMFVLFVLEKKLILFLPLFPRRVFASQRYFANGIMARNVNGE